MRSEQHVLQVETSGDFSLHDITPDVRQLIKTSGIANGFVTIASRHTTTAICVNEFESRLLDDFREYFQALVPADRPYKHNDLHLRPHAPEDEPKNAHSHIMALLIGSSEVVPIMNGELAFGRFQDIMLVELDGPKKRTVQIQIVGE